jgi:hypothetical protein
MKPAGDSNWSARWPRKPRQLPSVTVASNSQVGGSSSFLSGCRRMATRAARARTFFDTVAPHPAGTMHLAISMCSREGRTVHNRSVPHSMGLRSGEAITDSCSPLTPHRLP